MFQDEKLAEIASASPRRICVIKPSALGDVAQAMPLIDVLAHRFPSAELGWVIASDLAGLVTDHPQLARVHRFDRQGNFARFWSLLRELRQARYDWVFDLQGLLRTGAMTWASGATVRIGLETAREGSSLACQHLLPNTGRDVPAHQRYWRVAEWLGCADRPWRIVVARDTTDDAAVSRWLDEAPRPWLAIAPGARWVTKQWPIEKFARVAAQWERNVGGSLFVVGGKADRSLGEAIAQQTGSPRVVNLCGQTSLKQLAALLQRVDLLLSNDSGPLHLAAELGTRVVGIYTCTSPRISGPSGSGHELVASQLECAASYFKTCPLHGPKHRACLREIDERPILAAMHRALATLPISIGERTG